MPSTSHHLRRPRIDPTPIARGISLVDLVDGALLAYNGARLREACQLFAKKMLEPDVTIGMSVTGRIVPSGLGGAALAPLFEAGFVDWVITTGANLFYDVVVAMGGEFRQIGAPSGDESDGDGVRLYDLGLDPDALRAADRLVEEILSVPDFAKPMGTAELHHRLGGALAERAKHPERSLLVSAYASGVPLYASSPVDSSIGLVVARLALDGKGPVLDPLVDVNETAAIVWDAKRSGGTSAAVILGGGSPKNFLLQTEPQIQEVLGLPEKGHDYFLQITDARADTGGLSGATPGEAVSWGKVDPSKLPDTVVCYTDLTVALPVLAGYALATHAPRERRRLYDRREALLAALGDEYRKSLATE